MRLATGGQARSDVSFEPDYTRTPVRPVAISPSLAWGKNSGRGLTLPFYISPVLILRGRLAGTGLQ